MKVAVVHDHLVQRGGAERIAALIASAYPGAPLYTSVYDPELTHDALARLAVRPMKFNSVSAFRRNHRALLPLFAPAFSRLKVDADLVICSTAGWSHGVRTDGKKLAYVHAPARWLYASEEFLRTSRRHARAAATVLRWPLHRWDRNAMSTVDRVLANSTETSRRLRAAYGIEAEVLFPPPTLRPDGPSRAVSGIAPGYVLCVSRLLGYKNVEKVVAAFTRRPHDRLVVAGAGPELGHLREMAGPNVALLGRVEDECVRWLYTNCRLLVTAAYEDFGLTPLEAASFGKPVAALRWGGHLDSISPESGHLFEEPSSTAISDAIDEVDSRSWSPGAIKDHSARFSAESFTKRLREVGAELLGSG